MSSGDDDYGNPQREIDTLRAELTRLRTANAAMRAECKAWRAYEAFIEDGAKSNTESANHHDRIGECRQLTDSTPGAMEGT